MLQLPGGVLKVLAVDCYRPDATLNYVVVKAATTTQNGAEAETDAADTNVAEKHCCDWYVKNHTNIYKIVSNYFFSTNLCKNTVSLKRHNLKNGHTFSFIIDSSQVLLWVSSMAKGLGIDQTSFLVVMTDATTRSMRPDEIARQIERQRDHQQPQQQQKSQVAVAELTVTRISKAYSEPSEEEQLATANKFREAGNNLFKHAQNFKDYRKVQAAYTRALNFGPVRDEKSRIALRSNIAILSLRTTDYSFCLIDTDAAEATLDRSNEQLENDFRAKVIFRRALALFKMEFYIKVLNDINEAARLKPDDKLIISEQKRFSNCITDTFEKRRKEFAEVYNVMIQSCIFKKPLLV